MNLKQAILVSLKNVHPCRLPQTALLVDVNSMSGKTVTRRELEIELSIMQSRNQVTGLTDEVTGVIKWKLTDDGLDLAAG